MRTIGGNRDKSAAKSREIGGDEENVGIRLFNVEFGGNLAFQCGNWAFQNVGGWLFTYREQVGVALGGECKLVRDRHLVQDLWFWVCGAGFRV